MDLKEIIEAIKKKGYSIVETKKLESAYSELEQFKNKEKPKEDVSENKEEPKKENTKELTINDQLEAMFNSTSNETPPVDSVKAILDQFKQEMTKMLGSNEEKKEKDILRQSIPASNHKMYDLLSEKYEAKELVKIIKDMGLDDPSNSGYQGTAAKQIERKNASNKLADTRLAQALGLSSEDYDLSTDSGEDSFGQMVGRTVQTHGANGGGALADGLTKGFKEFFGAK